MRTAILVAALAGALAACGPHYEAEKAVKELLNDPDSAKFTSMRTGANGATCGLVNAKNRMGGYVGGVPFFYEPAAKYVAIVKGVEESDFRSLYLAKDTFTKEYTAIASHCREHMRFKDVCGVDHPAEVPSLCREMGSPTFARLLHEKYR